jgi:L-lactate dehydrogenase complex protein LldG
VTSKDKFLERVRKALGRPTAMQAGNSGPTALAFPPLGPVLAPVPERDYIGSFEEELRKVGGVTHQARSRTELDQTFREILGSVQPGEVVLSRNPLLQSLQLSDLLRAQGYETVTWPSERQVTADEVAQFRARCFSAVAGITGAEFALVESGTFVLTSVMEGSQLVSLAPPMHIVLYRRGQVVESLEEVLTGLRNGPNHRDAGIDGRSIVFITGQSRTADIEQITIRGVHGPLSIHSILVEEACLGGNSGSP